MGNLVKQILGGLWQVLTYRGGWVKPIKNSLPVASFLAVVAIIVKSLALFITYSIDQQTPLTFAFSGVAVELVSMALGMGLVVLVAGQRKLFSTLFGGLMYLAIISVFVGALVAILASTIVTSANLTLGQMQSLWTVIGLAYIAWFFTSVGAIIKHGLKEKLWRVALLTVVFMATSHIVVAVWQKVFFPNIL